MKFRVSYEILIWKLATLKYKDTSKSILFMIWLSILFNSDLKINHWKYKATWKSILFRICLSILFTSVNNFFYPLRQITWLIAGSSLKITDNMLCAGVSGTNLSGCHGDSGGPYVCQTAGGNWVLQGAVSWGSARCSAAELYTVFARVAKFRNWIDQKMKSWRNILVECDVIHGEIKGILSLKLVESRLFHFFRFSFLSFFSFSVDAISRSRRIVRRFLNPQYTQKLQSLKLSNYPSNLGDNISEFLGEQRLIWKIEQRLHWKGYMVISQKALFFCVDIPTFFVYHIF